MKKIEKYLPLFILLILAGIFSYLGIVSEGDPGGEDSYNHFLSSHFAPTHPILFFNHWAKPLFVLLSAPFAQGGFIAGRFFNIFCALTTGYFAFLICRELKLKFAWSAIIFACAAPIYFITIPTNLTEPLFSVVLIASVYFYLKDKITLSLIILSFLPFARTEGYGIIAIFVLVLILHKRFKYIPLVLTGTIIYSIGGWFFYDDILWVMTKNPYVGTELYGRGSLTHYFDSNRLILGTFMVILAALGLIHYLREYFKRPSPVSAIFKSPELWLLYGCFSAYYLLHVILWWQGLAGSYGLIRVMAAVSPLIAISATRGTNLIAGIFPERFQIIIPLAVSLYAFTQPFNAYELPFKIYHEEQLIKEVCEWLKKEGPGHSENGYKYTEGKVIYSAPSVCVRLGLNPYINTESQDMWITNEEKSWHKGSLIVWDSHYSANESGVPLEFFTKDPAYELIKVFKPEIPVKTLNGYDYEVYIFKKLH